MNEINFGIVTKVKSAIDNSEYDAVIAFGRDNVQYLSGTKLPCLFNYPERFVVVLWSKRGEPLIICPLEWKTSLHNESWLRRTYSYNDLKCDSVNAVIKIVSDLLQKEIHGKKGPKIGIDKNRVPFEFFKELINALPNMEIVGCDAWLNELRMAKTQEEIKILEDVAHRTDHGILGAVHHVLSTMERPEKGLAELIRVHCLERNLDVVGYHSVSQAASGEHAKKFWPLAPKFGVGWGKILVKGEMVRMEMKASLNGYWSNAARILIMGDPSPKQKKAYENLVALRETAVENIKPGTECNQVFKRVKEFSKKKGIKLISDLGVGHGIGVSSFEPPYLNECDDTEIKKDMVLVIDPVIYGSNQEIMRSKDTVHITDKGCEIIGWYKDWREPYLASKSYASGPG